MFPIQFGNTRGQNGRYNADPSFAAGVAIATSVSPGQRLKRPMIRLPLS
jgi:hypothetical protein